MPTVRAVLWTQKKNTKGHSPIYLRISDAQKTRYISLGELINPRFWNQRLGEVRKTHPNAQGLNALISRKLDRAKEEMLRMKVAGESLTVDHLRLFLADDTPPGVDFFAFADGLVKDLSRRGQEYTRKRYESILKKFRAFTGEPLPFDRLTPELLRRYETHLIEKYGNSTNTVATNLNALKTMTRKAIAEGHLKPEKNPFFLFRIARAKTSREKLTWPAIRRIEALELEQDSLQWHVRNYFLFSFYAAGIRFGDLCKLTNANIQRDAEGTPVRLEYRMSKTGSRKSIKLQPEAQRIAVRYLDQYKPEARLFPLLDGYRTETEAESVSAISSRNALVNKYLKKLAELAKIETHMSFHIARHSFADIARQQGWDVYTISKALGHSSIAKTETYLAGFDDESLDRRMEEFGDGQTS